MQNNNHKKRLKKLTILSTLAATVLIASTLAWFIGTQTVNVAAFDVKIASTDSLLLSLDGVRWSDTIEISEDSLDEVSYVGHQNTWGGSGLTPVSTIGEMDTTASRLMLFEKGSFTKTPGGYRIMSSRVNNYTESLETPGLYEELDGYVAFDLFVRNFTGRQYIREYNPLDEEAIYLTTNSQAVVSTTGGTAGTGIENSVRVAFAQIGRVKGDVADMDASVITGITCSTNWNEEDPIDEATDVTGICGKDATGRPATIWEPNDMDHVQSALNYYTESCRIRTGADVTAASYTLDTKCSELGDDVYYPTYAVKEAITSAMAVDTYDGLEYNTYEDTTELQKVGSFTDTMKNKKGVERPPIMTLAPNSITKVRVYVYIEGQDIDNYDFASMGRQITVNFGFTKERFEPEDIEYSGPPLITLMGKNPFTLDLDDVATSVDPGAVGYAVNADGDAVQATVTSDWDTVVKTATEAGTVTVTYTLTDAATTPRTTTLERTVVITQN